MIMKKNNLVKIILFLISVMTLSACGVQSHSHTTEKNKNTVDFTQAEKTDSLNLKYAEEFSVDKYGDYSLITIDGGSKFLIVPENCDTPSNVPSDIYILKQPLDKTYLVSTSVMDLISRIGAVSDIRLSGTKEKNWYVEDAVKAMENGDMLYAGKYSAPDYELILNEGCNLVIENTMIYHNPEVKEKLENLGIPVLVEKSSYEKNPLGRLEWIKLYGVLYGKETEAERYFDSQSEKIEAVMQNENTGKTIAFFSVTQNGSVTVRKPNDYISQMIHMAGGNYIIQSSDAEENALSTMNMQMEDFYAAAKNADILIYNSTIEGEITSVSDLTAKDNLFNDFKAVKDGNVYCTSNNFFQKSTGIAEFIEDLNTIFTDGNTDNLTFLKRLR